MVCSSRIMLWMIARACMSISGSEHFKLKFWSEAKHFHFLLNNRNGQKIRVSCVLTHNIALAVCLYACYIKNNTSILNKMQGQKYGKQQCGSPSVPSVEKKMQTKGRTMPLILCVCVFCFCFGSAARSNNIQRIYGRVSKCVCNSD